MPRITIFDATTSAPLANFTGDVWMTRHDNSFDVRTERGGRVRSLAVFSTEVAYGIEVEG